jgi:hypothetical protein
MAPTRPAFTASNLLPGQTYRVKNPFIDYDGRLHPVGETWLYSGKSFSPHDDGLTLWIEQNGQAGSIRLEWLPATQAQVIEHFSEYVSLEETGRAAQPPAPAKKHALKPWLRVLIALLAGLGLICLVAFGGLFWFINALSYHPRSTSVPNIIFTKIKTPYSTHLNQDFVLEVEVSNTSNQPVQLQAIELPIKYLDGFTMLSSDPPFSKGYKVIDSSQYFRYEIAAEIPAQGSLPVRFTLKPIKTGLFTGTISICVDAPQPCTINSVDTITTSP